VHKVCAVAGRPAQGRCRVRGGEWACWSWLPRSFLAGSVLISRPNAVGLWWRMRCKPLGIPPRVLAGVLLLFVVVVVVDVVGFPVPVWVSG